MEAPKKRLYKRLADDGLYTKTFEEFEKQYSDPAKQQKLYEKLSGDGLYTKSKEEFLNGYFPVKKKDASVSPSTTTKPKSESATSAGSSDLLKSNSLLAQDHRVKPVPPVKTKTVTPGPSKYKEGSMAWTQEKLKQSDPSYSQLYDKFKQAEAVSEEKVRAIRQEVEQEAKNTGWAATGKRYWNNAVDAITTLGSFGEATKAPDEVRFETDALAEEKAQAKKELVKLQQQAKAQKQPAPQITNDAILERAKEIKVQKRIKSQQETQVRSFLEDAEATTSGPGTRNMRQELMLFEAGENSTLHENDKLLLKKQNLLRPAIDNSQLRLKEIKREASAYIEKKQDIPESLQQEFETEKNRYQQLVDDAVKTHEEYVSNTKALGKSTENLDVFKRDYSWSKNFVGNLYSSVTELAAGVDGFVDYASQFDPKLMTLGLAAREHAKQTRASGQQVRDEIMKPIDVENINSMEDFGSWLSHTVIAQQLPIYALVATGTAGVAAIGATSIGQKYETMRDEIDAGTQEYSQLQLAGIPLAFGATETASAMVDRMLFKNAARVLRSATAPERRLIAQGFTEQTLNGLKNISEQTAKGVLYEGVEESLTQISQNLIDIYAGDKEDVKIWDNVKNAGAAGAAMGALLPFGSNVAATLAKPFTADATIKDASAEIARLQEQLNNPDLTDIGRSAIEVHIAKTEQRLEKALRDTSKRISSLSDDLFQEVVALEKDQAKLQRTAREIQSDTSIDGDTKKLLLAGLKTDFEANDSRRLEIVNGKISENATNDIPTADNSGESIAVANDTPVPADENVQANVPETKFSINETAQETNTEADGDVRPGAVTNEQDGEQQSSSGESIQATTNAGTSAPTPKTYRLGATDKAANYTVEKVDGRLDIRNDKGEEPSAKTKAKIEDLYAEEADYTSGEVAPYIADPSIDINDHIARSSNNAAEVAQTLLSIDNDNLVQNNISHIDRIIAENIGFVSRQSFIDNSDANNIGLGLAKTYLRKDGRPLDTLAQEWSELAGVEITEQDIVDFMLDNQSGSKTLFGKIKREARQGLEKRFTELTGLPAKDKYLQKAVEQKNFTDKFATGLNFVSDEALLALDAELERFTTETNGEPEQQTKKTDVGGTEASADSENISERSEESGLQGTRGAENTGRKDQSEPGAIPRGKIVDKGDNYTGAINDLLEKIKAGPSDADTQVLGYLSKEGKQYLGLLSGLEFKELTSLVVSANDLRHIYKGHYGNNESFPGNIPLGDEDFIKIEDILNSPDRIEFMGYDEKAQSNKFRFVKEDGDGTYHLIEVYSHKKGRLSVKTFYKKKKKDIKQRPDATSATDRGLNAISAESPSSETKVEKKSDNLNSTEQASTQSRDNKKITERIKPERRTPINPPKKLNKIISDAASGLKATIIYGRTGRAGGLGSYNSSNSLTRIRRAGDIDTAAHEIGHLLDDRFDLYGTIPSEKELAIIKELQWFSERGGSNPSSKLSAAKKAEYLQREGIGEFVRAYIANPAQARIMAPEFTAHFELALNSGTLRVVKQLSDDYLDYANATAGEQIISNVEDSSLPNKSGFREWMQRFKSEDGEFNVTPFDRLNSHIFNSLTIANKSFKFLIALNGDTDLLPEKNFEMMSRLFAGINGKTSRIMSAGMIDAKNNIIEDADGNAMNLQWLFDPLDTSSEKALTEEMNDVIKLLIAERTVEYANKFQRLDELTGIGGGIDADIDVAQGYLNDFEQLKTSNREKHDRVKLAAKRYRDYADAGLQYAVQKGRISKETYQLIKDNNEYYVSLTRVQENAPGEEVVPIFNAMGGGIASVKDIFQKAKGGTAMIQNPYLSLLQNTVNMIKESDRNQVLSSFIEPLQKVREFGDGQPVDFSQIARPAQTNDKNVKPIFVKGVEQRWQFSQEVFDALTSLEKAASSKVFDFLAMPSDLIRFTVTNFPTFALRNAVRDTTSRLVVTRTGSGLKDLIHNATDKELFELYGGSQAGFFLTDKNAYKQHLKETIKEITAKGGIVLDPRYMWRGYKKLLEKGENLNRIAEFKSAYRKAKKEGLDDYNAGLYAAYQARDLMDFAVAGHTIRQLNRIIPFLNAGVQGLRRTARAAKDDPAGFAVRTALFTVLPTIAFRSLVAYMGEDEEYEQLPAYQRDLFWNFKTPATGDVWLSIPKPFDQGMVSSAVDRGISQYKGVETAWNGFGGSIAKTLTPMDESSLMGGLRPILEVSSNYNYFTDRNIIPAWEEGKMLELRKGTGRASRTSQTLSKGLKALNWEVDPRNVDHLLTSYGTYMSDWGLSLGDLGVEDSRFRFDWQKTGFAKNTPVTNSVSVTAAYKLAAELGAANSGEVKRLRKLIENYYTAEDPAEKKEISRSIYQYATELRKNLQAKKDKVKKATD